MLQSECITLLNIEFVSTGDRIDGECGGCKEHVSDAAYVVCVAKTVRQLVCVATGTNVFKITRF